MYVQRHIGHGNINSEEEGEGDKDEVFVGGEFTQSEVAPKQQAIASDRGRRGMESGQ